ncbi:MAG: universal stress protein [Haloferacaceae archaeon]
MTVLAAIDGEEGSERVVSRGHELATAFDEDLVVFHAKQTEDGEVAERVARDVAESALDDPASATVVGRRGNPAERVLKEADERDVDYIVLGPPRRTPMGKMLLGSVAQLVILNTDRSVVIAGE